MTKQILKGIVVDDDSDDLEFFQAACDEVETDINLKTFSSCNRLFDFLRDENYTPDIVFLDINMPVKSGFDCLMEIREQWTKNERCVIMYSTSNSKADIKKCFELGASGFLQKPYSFSGLKDILKQIFEKDWSDPCENLAELDFIITPG